MPFAFPRCHCEKALAEDDAAIQSESLCALPMVPLDCHVAYAPRNDGVYSCSFMFAKKTESFNGCFTLFRFVD